MTSAAKKSRKLRALIQLLNDASEVVITEWEAQDLKNAKDEGRTNDEGLVPSAALYEARRTILGACGMCSDLVQEPGSRLMEVSNQYYISRALYVAAEARVANILADADPTTTGVPIEDISAKVNIQAHKLLRVLRVLCSVHIFAEVRDRHFANNPTSQYLCREPLRCWVLLHGTELYAASTKLPAVLFDPVKTHSFSPRETAFQESKGTAKTFWEYLEEGEEQPDGTVKPRRMVEIFNLAMVGGGRTHSASLYADFPWEALGECTIVDVGGGVGGMSLDLAKRFPKLRFIVQDVPAVIRQAEAVWLRGCPGAIETKRTQLMGHDFFTAQPVKGADVYLMRSILHDWPDDECVAILTELRKAMAPHSRILSTDQAINTTVGSPHLKRAPAPLPANYGYAHQMAGIRDMNMMTMFNGMERTPQDFSALAERAGLRVVKVWEGRGLYAITEMGWTDR
ncbi:S-adenosyl-L-methionine-dependent methyltransferase [Sparassis latifolia]